VVVETHKFDRHWLPIQQITPHWPQLRESVAVLVHVPEQLVEPTGHVVVLPVVVHEPLVHT
jgi:hypothetical protein